MRKSKASKKRQPTKAKVTKRTTSRRATTSRSRTSRATARRTRRVSPKSIPPVSLIELPRLIEQAVAATPSLPSKRYPIRNLLVLFLAFAATTAVGGWAVYVTLFGEARQDIGAGTPPVIVDVLPAKAPSSEVAAPKAQDRVAATPSDAAISSISQEAPRSAPAAPEVTAAIPGSTSQPTAAGPGPAPQAPVAAKGKRRGHPEATVISPTGPGGGAYALVAEARRYLGTNPTGRKDLWCGAFVDLVLKRLGYKGGGNLASAYARYGTRIPGPQIGAIAVMTRTRRRPCRHRQRLRFQRASDHHLRELQAQRRRICLSGRADLRLRHSGRLGSGRSAHALTTCARA